MVTLHTTVDGTMATGVAVENLLQDTTLKLWKSMDRLRILVRAAPSLGLIGTLIPMGTGLAALGQGDMTKLTTDLVIAFTTTVVGLAIGTAAFFFCRPYQHSRTTGLWWWSSSILPFKRPLRIWKGPLLIHKPPLKFTAAEPTEKAWQVMAPEPGISPKSKLWALFPLNNTFPREPPLPLKKKPKWMTPLSIETPFTGLGWA